MLNDDITRLTTRFAALGDPIRLAIVDRLAHEGEVSAGALSAAFEVSAPAISRHLSVLRAAGIVHRRTDRQRRLYAIAPGSLADVALWTLSHRDFWQGSLARLDAIMALEDHTDDDANPAL